MKALFPLDIRTDFASFEVSSGLLRRPIHENTSWDQARYEVCGHRFCDMSESRFGVAVLNDCKYGYSVRKQTIGMSLLKAGEFPWELTDKMRHEFTYSVLCHDKPLHEAGPHGVYEQMNELNTPLWAVIMPKSGTREYSHNQILSLDASGCVTVLAFKQSERSPAQFVLRLAEVRGQETMAVITFAPELHWSDAKLCNGLERVSDDQNDLHFDVTLSQLKVKMEPFKIKSILLSTTQ